MLNAELNTIPWMLRICGILIHSPISQTKNIILLSQIKIRITFAANKNCLNQAKY